MSDGRAEIIHALRGLLDLERASGVEFIARLAPAATVPAAPRISANTPLPTYRAEPTRPTTVVAAPTVAFSAAPPASAPAPLLPAGDDTLDRIAAEARACTACGLCQSRKNAVPGEGNPNPELVFIGEGPGADEDATGRPFVGAAGQLLDRMITAMGFAREQVFIANVLKCRPPDNRTPAPDEIAACLGYLHRQLALLRPKLICTLGNTPLRALFNDPTLGITKLRGQSMTWRGIMVIPTFHPSYLLRNDSAKKPCWEDLKKVVLALGRTLPVRA